MFIKVYDTNYFILHKKPIEEIYQEIIRRMNIKYIPNEMKKEMINQIRKQI